MKTKLYIQMFGASDHYEAIVVRKEFERDLHNCDFNDMSFFRITDLLKNKEYDGQPIDYTVEEQISDWKALDDEYKRLAKAFDRAIELLDRNMLCEKCPFSHDTERCTIEGCKGYLKECLLNGNWIEEENI